MARPLEHKREEVIAAAMKVFWGKGYSATSMADLKIATGLNPGSLYASYHSKEDLFVSALESYCDQSLESIEAALLSDTNYIDNIYTFFKKFPQDKGLSGKGCFFVNTLIEMSPHNPRIKMLLEKYTDKYKDIFLVALIHAQKQGQISASSDVITKSSQIMLTIWGLRVMQRSGISVDTANIIEQQLNSILSN
jgi:TetR/AcrR family transcriptional repressor of nem operon